MKGYPISLVNLEQVHCLVVGGGTVAARKVGALLAAGAQITVISPALCPELDQLALEEEIQAIGRPYRQGDLEGVFLVIAATDDPITNQQVWKEAQSQGALVNVVDDPAHCNFIAPAVIRRGPLTLAISTDGQAPALSRHLRQELEQQFGPVYGRYVELLGAIRARAQGFIPPTRTRIFWKELLHSNILELLASGQEAEAQRLAEEIFDRNTSRES